MSFGFHFVQGDGLFPAKYKTKDLSPGATPLDPFHTHFILVDNGTVNKPGVEIKLRVDLESEIAKQCMLFINVHFHVHVRDEE
jgi:SLOG in TRPM